MDVLCPHISPYSLPRTGTKKSHLLRLGLLVRRKELVRERALHCAAMAEHTVVDETGRQALQGLLHNRVLLSDDVVVAYSPSEKLACFRNYPAGVGEVAMYL